MPTCPQPQPQPQPHSCLEPFQDATHVTETFDDVAGLTEAKANVVEVVNILRDPAKYQAMGARMPSGLLLVGPPGMLAKRCLSLYVMCVGSCPKPLSAVFANWSWFLGQLS